MFVGFVIFFPTIDRRPAVEVPICVSLSQIIRLVESGTSLVWEPLDSTLFIFNIVDPLKSVVNPF